MHMEFFEPTVMFFGITNLPDTFQVIINKILRDMINKGKVAAFVDDMLVGTETEEGYNEIVKEVLKRLEENDLYVKLEKCMWKVRKIGFLGVIIGPNGREVDSIIYKERKVYVSKNKKLRAEIIRLYHNIPVGEHGRQWKIVELVTRNFWWPEVTKKMKQYCYQ